VFAAIAGYTHARIYDSGLSVLMVTGFSMFLAYKRPKLVWWWAAVIGLSLPAAVLLNYLTREKPTLGMVAGAFAGLAFSIVASVGGKVLRQVVHELFPGKKSQELSSETRAETVEPHK
jgi:Na+/proline symporter